MSKSNQHQKFKTNKSVNRSLLTARPIIRKECAVLSVGEIFVFLFADKGGWA